MEKANIVPWEADPDSMQFTYAGGQVSKIFGYPVEDWYETGFWSSHVHPDDRENVVAYCQKHSAISDHYELEYRMVARNGRVIWIRDLVSVIREGGKARSVTGFMIDVTERKQTEEQLRELSGVLINAQEDERRRVARELHDDLNQRMALLSIELEQLGQKIPARQTELREGVNYLQLKAQEISTEIHRMSYRLHPSKLDHLGLATALKSYCDEISVSHQLAIDFRQFGFPAQISDDVTLCVFRIAQESLRNVIKHSGARSALVVLERTASDIRLAISDHGCGFEPGSPTVRRGLGFVSMSERLRLVGGEILIQSHPSRGTQINVTVPLPQNYSSSDS